MRRRPVLPVLVGVLLACVLVSQQVKSEQTKRLRVRTQADVLRAIPKHNGVLINIHRRLFPATWDITLLGQQSTRALRRGLLGNTSASVRWRCAQVLTQLRDASARATLHQALSDWNPAVRGQALLALAEVGDKSSVPFILRLLGAPNEIKQNRARALKALGLLGDARGTAVIIAQYDKALKGKSPLIRRMAVHALWDLRRTVPEKTLRVFLRRALQDKDQQVVRRAAIALGVLKDASSLARLKQLLMGESRMLRNVTAYVLGQIGDKRAIPILVGALPHVRSGRLLNNISFALQRLKDPKLWERLKNFLQHRQAFIRLNAAFTIGDMKLKQAEPLLRKALKDPNLLVRNQAILALAKLGQKKSITALLKMLKSGTWEQKWLSMLAVIRLSQERKYRDLFLRVVQESRHLNRRRQAAMVLAAQKDERIAPFFFYWLARTSSSNVWKAAAKFKSPLLRKLLFARLKSDLQKSRTHNLSRLLKLLNAHQDKSLRQHFLRILFVRWYRPYYRPRSFRKSYRSREARQSMKYFGKYNQNKAMGSLGGLKLFRHSNRWGRSGFQSVLRTIIRVLGKSGDKSLRRWLSYFLTHRSYHVRTETHLALAQLGAGDSLQLLFARLLHASDHHRPYLVDVLGQLPAKMLKKKLQKAIKRPDPYLRLALGATMWRCGIAQGLKILLDGVRANQASVRERAVFYLKRLSSKKLRALLRKVYRKEKDPIVRIELMPLLRKPKPTIRVLRHFRARKVFLF